LFFSVEFAVMLVFALSCYFFEPVKINLIFRLWKDQNGLYTKD